MSSDAERAAIRHIVQSYMVLYAQQRWDEWIDLWTDDGVLEFPFAPPGRRGRYAGKPDILGYMKAVAQRMAGRVKIDGMEYFHLHPMRDPATACLEMGVNGRVVETGAPYRQKYVSLIETKDGKISLFKEYWNPLVSMDAQGGRDAWTASFGSPEAAS